MDGFVDESELHGGGPSPKHERDADGERPQKRLHLGVSDDGGLGPPPLTPLPAGAATDDDESLGEVEARIQSSVDDVSAKALADLRRLILKKGQKFQEVVCKSTCLAAVLKRLTTITESPCVVEAACRVVCTIAAKNPVTQRLVLKEPGVVERVLELIHAAAKDCKAAAAAANGDDVLQSYEKGEKEPVVEDMSLLPVEPSFSSRVQDVEDEDVVVEELPFPPPGPIARYTSTGSAASTGAGMVPPSPSPSPLPPLRRVVDVGGHVSTGGGSSTLSSLCSVVASPLLPPPVSTLNSPSFTPLSSASGAASSTTSSVYSSASGAMWALCALIMNNPPLQEVISCNKDTVEDLKTLLGCDVEEVQSASAWTLCNIAAGVPAVQDRLVHVHNVVEPLLLLMKNGAASSKGLAAWAVRSLVFEHAKNQVCVVEDCGGMGRG